MENNTEVFLGRHDFLERMRPPSAADIVKSIKSFIVSFINKVPDPEKDSQTAQEFLSNMEATFRAHPLWAGCTEEELESAGEQPPIVTYLYPILRGHVGGILPCEESKIAANDNRKKQGSLPSELPATPPRKPENVEKAKAISDLNDCESISKVPSLSELENKGAAILLKEDEPNKTFQEYPYLFAQVGDLTVNGVEDLLNSYKQLAFEYICFSKGLGVMECIEKIKSEESVGRRDGVVPGDDDQSLSRSLRNDPV